MTSRWGARAAALAATVAVLFGSIGVAPAWADTLVYFEGVALEAPSGPQSPTRPLSETSVRHIDGGGACTNAKNLEGNPVGDSYCVAGGGVAAHPYCGCVERRAWAHSVGGPFPLATLRARVNW